MSIWGHRVSAKLVVTAVAVLLLGAFAVALTRPAPREITLVVRGMAFYLDGNPNCRTRPSPSTPANACASSCATKSAACTHDFAVPAMRRRARADRLE